MKSKVSAVRTYHGITYKAICFGNVLKLYMNDIVIKTVDNWDCDDKAADSLLCLEISSQRLQNSNLCGNSIRQSNLYAK